MKLFIVEIFIILSFESLMIETKSRQLMIESDFAKIVESDENHIRFISFKFYKKSRTLAALNVSYEIMEDVTSDEQTKVIIAALQYVGNEYKRTVIDFSIGICSLYRANKFDSLNLIKNSNLTGCPFAKGAYYINDMSPTADLLPPFFPEGKWLLDLSFTMWGKTIARINWALSIIKKM